MTNREKLRWLDARMRLGDSSPVVQRELHVRWMLSRARTRLKRATTILRKWERKVRYYERRKP